MFHHLFFVMSLSGSLVVLLYGLTYPIAQRYFPHSWRKKILCLSLFLYLIPFPLLKEFILSLLTHLHFKNYDADDFMRIDPKYTINIQHNQFFLGANVAIVYIFAFCMAVIASVLIIKQLKQYGAVYHAYLLKSFYETPLPQLERAFQQTKEEPQVKKPVKLILSRLCDAPMTIGVFSPVIVFPASGKLNLSTNDNKYILKHELLHIKNGDLLLKFLALLALAVHWYNPICYLLYYELCVVSEINCDYGVIKDADDAQRQQYSHLIIDLAVASNSRKERFAVGLVNNDAATFERRILEMKKTRKTTKYVLSWIMTALICILGTITAFAYEAPQRHILNDFNSESTRIFSVSDSMENVEQFVFDYFFTDEEGHVTPLNDLSERAFCIHDYIEGETTDHAREKNGGCIVTVRSAKKCRICNSIIEGEIISEHKYVVCPH